MHVTLISCADAFKGVLEGCRAYDEVPDGPAMALEMVNLSAEGIYLRRRKHMYEVNVRKLSMIFATPTDFIPNPLKDAIQVARNHQIL
jgi:hypothetical protein